MILTAEVYVYVLVFTALVTAAAAAIEWGMQGRMPVRHLWSGAICVALVVPPAALAWRSAATDTSARRIDTFSKGSGEVMTVVAVRGAQKLARRAASVTVTATATAASTLVSRDAPIRFLIVRRHGWRATIARMSTRLTPALAILWIIASATLTMWLVAGALHWRRARRSWYHTSLDGVEVEVSPNTGPAVLGVISHRIVMPEWAMLMSAEQRKLVLAHECEHVVARDPERLVLAVLAVVLMPWNAALWWCAARLRRAIELDCDARVLRSHPGAKEYGHMLLNVAARGQDYGLTGIPVVALLQLPSELELRLRAMTRPRSVGMRTLTIGGVIGVLAVTGAFAAPIPRLRFARHITVAVKPAPALRLAGTEKVGRARADSLHILAQRNDSLASVARQLARKVDRLESEKAKRDSADAALRTTYARLKNAEFVREHGLIGALRQKDIPAAIRRYYPGLSTSAKPGMLLWFVVDSSGRVLRTARNEAYKPGTFFSSEKVADRFGDMSLHVSSLAVMPVTVGNTDVTVVWSTAARP